MNVTSPLLDRIEEANIHPDDCPICLQELDDDKTTAVVLEPCGHVFCQACVQKLVDVGHLTCPCCKKTYSSHQVQVVATGETWQQPKVVEQVEPQVEPQVVEPQEPSPQASRWLCLTWRKTLYDMALRVVLARGGHQLTLHALISLGLGFFVVCIDLWTFSLLWKGKQWVCEHIAPSEQNFAPVGQIAVANGVLVLGLVLYYRSGRHAHIANPYKMEKCVQNAVFRVYKIGLLAVGATQCLVLIYLANWSCLTLGTWVLGGGLGENFGGRVLGIPFLVLVAYVHGQLTHGLVFPRLFFYYKQAGGVDGNPYNVWT